MNSNEKKQINYIAVLGFVLSLVSIPFFFVFVGQLLSLTLSILGYADCVKCNNKGRSFAVMGIITSGILLTVAPVAMIHALKYGIERENIDILTFIRVIWYIL